MDKARKLRTVLRTAFTRVANQLEAALTMENLDFIEVHSFLEMLDKKVETLQTADKEILDLMLENDSSEDDLSNELRTSDEYVSRYTKLKICCSEATRDKTEVLNMRENDNHVSEVKRKYKLPKIEFKKFGGEIKEWLPFWSQFRKIHEDTEMEAEDKFQYLIQATIQGTRARDLVESFPATRENYEKAVDSMKSRFGRDDLLVEVYVRELLKLVLNNALSSNKNKTRIAKLYDQIESQLRALDTLGVSTEKCAAMLYPLVESCLPEELLRVWQRNSNFSNSRGSTLKDRLSNLMTFLKDEVEGEERIALAVSGFRFSHDEPRNRQKKVNTPSDILTAAGLFNYTENQSSQCVFCNGKHPSKDCFKAQKMSLSEKSKALSEKGCCFLCLKTGHIIKKCTANIKCVACGGKHVVLMCPKTKMNCGSTEKKYSPSKDETRSEKSSVTIENTLTNHMNTEVFLPTLEVVLRNGNIRKKVRALIDTGSQRSFILKETAEKLCYPVIRKEKIIHSLFGGQHTSEDEHVCYKIYLSSLNKKYHCNFEALDQEIICSNIPAMYNGPWTGELITMGIKLTDTSESKYVELLIGADVAGKLFTGNRQILNSGLVALESMLGWTVLGKVPTSREQNNTTMTVTSLLTKDMNVAELWQLDILGITDPGKRKTLQELQATANEHFEKTVSRNADGRYEVTMPWLEGHPPLPSNLKLAHTRLKQVINKLKASGFYEAYDQVFHEWLQEGIIEEVPEAETSDSAHYLPHRPVIKESSATTKIRPVFDASARNKNEPSLNHCLEKGINLIELIPSILLRFRIHRIGVVSDIRKAFLQISLHEKERDYLRFLWKNENKNVKIFRHKRVVFGVCCSPYLLGATIRYHLQQTLRQCEAGDATYTMHRIRKLMESFYVDNCITSVEDEVELYNFITEASQVMAEAQFDLRGWEYTLTKETKHEEAVTPVLGLEWDRQADTLSIHGECLPSILTETVTKRFILSIAQRVFDPIGFTSPVTLWPKLLLQKIWESKIGWDTEVDENVKSSFLKWFGELSILQKIKIPRWISGGHMKNGSLHIFCDASQSAYATAIFFRTETEDGVHIQLLQAKARVAPNKKMSIPRLELLAATIAARLYTTIRETFTDTNITSYFWSDSSTVISWIRRDDEWATFVWNRVQEIRNLTSKDAWRHVPGILNPADLPSRGCSAKYLLESRWFEGPEWLLGPPEKWPEFNNIYDEEEINNERKRLVSSISCTKSDLWYCNYFSQYQKNVRLMGWIQRFLHNCQQHSQLIKGELSAQEIGNAEKILIKLIQSDYLNSEKDKHIASLNPFKDEDGLIRLRTKISYREDIEDFRYPMVLPPKHPLVEQLIRDTHVNSCHVGVQGLLSLLRERFWILGGRRTIKAVIKKCISCRRQSAKKIETVDPPLPVNRVRDAAVFEITGMDLAGPIFLKGNTKAWICMFTCGVYRAVHLELVTSLSTTNFLQAFRRFIARRGRPTVVYSDNGTNFVGAENAFSKLDWNAIVKYGTIKRISWKFNPPTAAWWGGWWERLIRLLKQLLRRVLGKASLTYEEMVTILCDCEAVINSRPITYVSEDSSDLIALTPAMFLGDIQEIGVPDCDKVDAIDLNKRRRYQQKLKEILRHRFRNEYLGQLRQASGKKTQHQISVGDVVMVGNDSKKRLDWPLGRIEKLLPGRDGEVRLVRVKTANGQLFRPIQRIYALECTKSCTVEEDKLQPIKE